MNHIITRHNDVKLEDWIILIVQRYKQGKNIEYRSQKTKWYNVGEKHLWDFYGNEYRIVEPRRFIIEMSSSGDYCIAETSDCWSGSDYGKDTNGSTYFLMEEIDH